MSRQIQAPAALPPGKDPPWYPWNKKLGEPQDRPGRFGDEKNSCPCWHRIPDNPVRDLATELITLSRLLILFILTYLLTPRSRVLLEKLTGSAASQEIPRIFGTRRFITVLTSARHLSLS